MPNGSKDNVFVKVKVSSTRPLKDLTADFDKFNAAANQLAANLKTVEDGSLFLDKLRLPTTLPPPPAAFQPQVTEMPPFDPLGIKEPEEKSETYTLGDLPPLDEELLLTDEILSSTQDRITAEETLNELTNERLQLSEQISDELTDQDNTGSFLLPDKAAWATYAQNIDNITNRGVRNAFNAAITGGDVGAVFTSMLTDAVTAAFMAAIGSQIASGLTSLLTLGFFQEGGYTGEREGLAYLHKHELVLNLDDPHQIQKLLNTTPLLNNVLSPIVSISKAVSTIATQAARTPQLNPNIINKFSPEVKPPDQYFLISNEDPTGIKVTEKSSMGSRVLAHYEA